MRSNTKTDPENTVALEHELKDLRDGIAQLSIDCTAECLRKFKDYIMALNHAQGRLHLISHRDYQRITRRHVLLSLMAKPFLAGTRLCDIGSGAGFPGIPLAIVDGGLRVVLFESIRKKADFLNRLRAILGLSNVEIVHGRAESYTGVPFDTILLRAVGTIKKNLKMIDRLLAPGGRTIFFKTHRIEQELGRAGSLMEKLKFGADVCKLYTPIEQRPLALVVLQRKAASSV